MKNRKIGNFSLESKDLHAVLTNFIVPRFTDFWLLFELFGVFVEKYGSEFVVQALLAGD